NMIIDALTKEFFGMEFDKNGNIAKNGKNDDLLLTELLSDQYFSQSPPKSTGRELFGEIFLRKFRELIESKLLDPENAIATATELTARSIVEAMKFLPEGILRSHETEIIAAGGGVKNNFLCHR